MVADQCSRESIEQSSPQLENKKKEEKRGKGTFKTFKKGKSRFFKKKNHILYQN